MTLESVSEKFKASGCPMFEAANLSSIREWMFVPSMERQQVLRLWLDKLDPCLEDLNPIVLKDLGLCTYLDATDFVTANMTKTRQLAIWTSIMDIALEDDDEQNDVMLMLLERCQHHESFIESISKSWRFGHFIWKKKTRN